MKFSCLNPGCGGVDFVDAKDANPVYGYDYFLGRWKQVVRGKVIICLRCESSMVKTKEGGYLTRRSMERIKPRVVETVRPDQNHRPQNVHPLEMEP